MSADLTVQTPLGALRGRAASNNVRAFLGVRYAEKVGRWRRPEAVKPWSGVADATTYGAKPPVAPPLASLGIPLLMPSDTPQSEDCHFLNVWAPSADVPVPPQGFPVMVWLYGGALASGESSMAAYAGDQLVAKSIEIGKPVVFVSINYRVNVFGFLASKELQEWGGYGGTGNLGFWDQRLGLLVTKQIIRAFGGNPDEITCFGESAGSVSTDVLSVAFAQEKLFKRAILQSGTVDTMKSKTVAEAQRYFDLFYTKAGGPLEIQGTARVEYLLTKSTDDLIKAYVKSLPTMIFFPVIDGVLFRSEPSTMTRGVEAVLQGTCKDEGTMFAAMLPKGDPEGKFTKLMIRAAVPKNYAAAQELYSAAKHGSWREAYSAYVNDTWFQHPARSFARTVSKQGPSVYKYRLEAPVQSAKHLKLGVFHASDIHFTHYRTEHLTASETKVADTVASHWITFAHTGRPAPDFPRFNDEARVLVYGSDGVKVEGEDAFRGEEMQFWDATWADEAKGKL